MIPPAFPLYDKGTSVKTIVAQLLPVRHAPFLLDEDAQERPPKRLHTKDQASRSQ